MQAITEKIYVDDETLTVEKAISIKAKKIRIQTGTTANTRGTWYNAFFYFVQALDPILFTIMAFDPETKRLYGVSKRQRLYMESDDVYGRQWHVILPVKWAKVRDKPGMQFITEVPFVAETRFTRLPAPEVTDTDVKGNRWGGQSLSR